ncbi:MAG: hypothetical protein ACPGXK_11840 [Phycisphaerae bacterium]
MSKIYLVLAGTNLGFIILSATLGLLSKEEYQVELHVLIAVFTALTSCLVQIVAFMYFSITGKLISQAVLIGKLSHDPIHQSKVYRRTATRWVGILITSLIPVVATGANRWGGGADNSVHLLLVCIMLAVHILVFTKQFPLIGMNHKLMEATMKDYREKRPRKSTPEADAVTS